MWFVISWFRVFVGRGSWFVSGGSVRPREPSFHLLLVFLSRRVRVHSTVSFSSAHSAQSRDHSREVARRILSARAASSALAFLRHRPQSSRPNALVGSHSSPNNNRRRFADKHTHTHTHKTAAVRRGRRRSRRRRPRRRCGRRRWCALGDVHGLGGRADAFALLRRQRAAAAAGRGPARGWRAGRRRRWPRERRHDRQQWWRQRERRGARAARAREGYELRRGGAARGASHIWRNVAHTDLMVVHTSPLRNRGGAARGATRRCHACDAARPDPSSLSSFHSTKAVARGPRRVRSSAPR